MAKEKTIDGSTAVNSLLDGIDAGLPARYKVLEGDRDTLYVKDRTNGITLKIKVEEVED